MILASTIDTSTPGRVPAVLLASVTLAQTVLRKETLRFIAVTCEIVAVQRVNDKGMISARPNLDENFGDARPVR